jgi:hypothetical protein
MGWGNNNNIIRSVTTTSVSQQQPAAKINMPTADSILRLSGASSPNGVRNMQQQQQQQQPQSRKRNPWGMF